VEGCPGPLPCTVDSAEAGGFGKPGTANRRKCRRVLHARRLPARHRRPERYTPTVHDLSYSPYYGVSDTTLQNYPTAQITSVGGFYTPDDGFRHVIVGMADGSIHEIFYSPYYGIFDTTVWNYGPSAPRADVPGGLQRPDSLNEVSIEKMPVLASDTATLDLTTHPALKSRQLHKSGQLLDQVWIETDLALDADLVP
jgi:hypothetical protein